MDGSDGGPSRGNRHQWIDIRVGVERRRKWSHDDRLRIVQESLADGAVIADIARRNQVASSMIYVWRKQALAGLLEGFHQVRIVADAAAELPALEAPKSCPAKTNSKQSQPVQCRIEVTLNDGTVVRVDGDAEHGALRTILASLGRRS